MVSSKSDDRYPIIFAETPPLKHNNLVPVVLKIKSKVDNIFQNFCSKIKGNRVRYTALVFGQAKLFNYLANGKIKKRPYSNYFKKEREKTLLDF
jgi:hypothetical protein